MSRQSNINILVTAGALLRNQYSDWEQVLIYALLAWVTPEQASLPCFTNPIAYCTQVERITEAVSSQGVRELASPLGYCQWHFDPATPSNSKAPVEGKTEAPQSAVRINMFHSPRPISRSCRGLSQSPGPPAIQEC